MRQNLTTEQSTEQNDGSYSQIMAGIFMGGAYAEKSISGRSAMAIVTAAIDDYVLSSFHWSDSLVRGSYGGLPILHILIGKGDMKWA